MALASHSVSCFLPAKRTNRHNLRHWQAALRYDGGQVADAGVPGVWEETKPITHNASAIGCIRMESQRSYRHERVEPRSADEGGQSAMIVTAIAGAT